MGSGLISIAVTGINAAQLALTTTSNNISNASTEGYSRQRVVQASNASVMTGSGAVGEGTHVVTIERLYSQTLTTQVLNAQTKVSSLDSYYAQASQIDDLLANSDSGISTSIQSFFKSLQSVASSPSSLSARQSLVSSAESMVSTFKSLYTSLNELKSGVNTQITSDVSSINSYAKQIADLNKQIVKTQGVSGQPANDLLDQRDLLVSKLNKLIGVSVTTADDGSYNVFFGSGQQLVVGATASTLSAVSSAADPTRTVVGIKTGSGSVQELPESLITGGELGGLMSFRSEMLDNSYNQLGTLAASVAETYNAQNALGQDLLGNVSGDTNFVANFFTTSNPTVIANSHNTGTATLTATLDAASWNGTNFYTNLKASDYKLSLSSDGATYTLTRTSDGTAWTGASISEINAQIQSTPDTTTYPNAEAQGFQLSTSSAVTAGDSYVIQPTRDLIRGLSVDATVSSDPRLIAAASSIAMSGATANSGTGSISGLSVSTGYSISGLGTTGLALTYDSATTSLSGFPTGQVVVTSGSTSTTYNVPTDTVPYTSGATITINSSDGTVSGLSFVLSGLPANNDTFTLSPNTGGTGDGSNIVLLGNLQTQNTMAGGTATYQDDYAAYVNDVGNKTSSASTSSSTMTTILKTATDAQSSVSGVNTDEEAAKLIEYQQAYQAAAKILEVASKIFDTLLAIS
jgi:flagellar hook-associated protein 1